MQYQQGKIGRVFLAKIEDGDDLLEELKNLAQKEEINSANFFLLGAMEKASFVGGPKACNIPPEPVWCGFADGRELLGIGTIFSDGEEPILHLHGVFGKGDTALMGCIRDDAKAYLIVEVVIYELVGFEVRREMDYKLGVKVLQM